MNKHKSHIGLFPRKESLMRTNELEKLIRDYDFTQGTLPVSVLY